ncbi:hypothetical protein OG976_01595 [Mycobacterium sp. NBC_00419]|uniref:hypothetical protein n=1 Tax=Mycobacterium sp. NBC_00419 TaxID=2975989 RepID=UPI002E1E0B35
MTPRMFAATVAVLAAAVMSGCSTTNSPAPASPTTTTKATGGETRCTKAQLADAAASAARALGKDNVYTIDDLQCADGWAVTSGLLASAQQPDRGAPTSFAFRAEGQSWVVQDKTKVCGTNPTTTTAPADATIPASLFLSGCAAG